MRQPAGLVIKKSTVRTQQLRTLELINKLLHPVHLRDIDHENRLRSRLIADCGTARAAPVGTAVWHEETPGQKQVLQPAHMRASHRHPGRAHFEGFVRDLGEM